MDVPIYMTIGDDGERFELGTIEDDGQMLTRAQVAEFFEKVAEELRTDKPDDFAEIPEGRPWRSR